MNEDQEDWGTERSADFAQDRFKIKRLRIRFGCPVKCEAIATILAGYGSAKSEAFAGHPLARAARRDFPDAVRTVIPEVRYLIEGSAGQGQWAKVPWTAVF